jgi:hypothetical protein
MARPRASGAALRMTLRFQRIFESLAPVPAHDGQIAYSVARVGSGSAYFVARDTNNKACVLIRVRDTSQRHAAIRLENLEVEFSVRARVTEINNSSETIFTIIRCRSDDRNLINYFLNVAEALIKILGPTPTPDAIVKAIAHLVKVFQRLLAPAAKPVAGLFGELLLIGNCANPVRAMTSWRMSESSRFDFSAGDLRIDVKTSLGRARLHTFAYDQCNPPPRTVAFVASLFAEVTGSGISISDLVGEIEGLISGRAELVTKLHETVASTLGASLAESMTVRFDERLATTSLQFFDLRTIPAIRIPLPPGLSDVHFRSDLSAVHPTAREQLIERSPEIEDFLPR